MNDDNRVEFKWSGPKSTWSEQEWQNYRSMPWSLRLPVDVFSIFARVFGWGGKRELDKTDADKKR